MVDIAETSRVDAELSRAHFEPVDLGALTGAMKPGWDLRAADEAQVALDRAGPGSAIVSGDESRLARLLDNLVDNALSFSPYGGTVRVIVAREGKDVLLTVEDEGPGVPEDQRERVFARFHSDRPDEAFGNHSGLGLAIARAIAEGHGGALIATSRKDGRDGARFELRLPAGVS